MGKKIISLEYYPKGSPIKQYQTQVSGSSISRPPARQTEIDQLSGQLARQKRDFMGMDTSNLWAGWQNQMQNIENVYEDVTIPQEAYDLKRRQREQSLATSLQAFQESGFGAGAAQLVANAAQRGAAEDTAQISQDIYKNELLKAGEASKLEILERQGETEAQKMRMQGAVDARNLGFQKQQALMSLTAGELASAREADAYKSANSGKVICTELCEQGYLPKEVLDLDHKHSDKHVDIASRVGYWKWAKYVVNAMKKSKIITHLVKPIGMSWAYEMAHREEPENYKSNLLGKLVIAIGVPICRYIGKKELAKKTMLIKK